MIFGPGYLKRSLRKVFIDMLCNPIAARTLSINKGAAFMSKNGGGTEWYLGTCGGWICEADWAVSHGSVGLGGYDAEAEDVVDAIVRRRAEVSLWWCCCSGTEDFLKLLGATYSSCHPSLRALLSRESHVTYTVRIPGWFSRPIVTSSYNPWHVLLPTLRQAYSRAPPFLLRDVMAACAPRW